MCLPISFHCNDLQRLKAIQQNFLEYFRPFQTLPNAIWHEDEASTWIIVPGAPGSHVLSVNVIGEVDTKLKQICLEHRKLTDFMCWLPTACDVPNNLVDRLEALGLKRKDDGEPVMIADLRATLAEPDVDALRISQVRNEPELRDWQRATGGGFGGGFDFAKIWGDTYLKKGLEPDNPFMHFTGYVDGKPVTSSSLLLAGGIAGVYDVSTIPAYRKRGLGRAMTLKAMQVAQQHGYEIAYLRASDEGFSVYRSLGFETLFHETQCIWETAAIEGSD
ncbi:MAG: GNAT family N-acetyltransferase [Candidatus Promineifilaceae bacterium]